MTDYNTKCPVCSKHNFKGYGDFEVCPICGWEDDEWQRRNPDEAGGANPLSLNQFKAEWAEEQERFETDNLSATGANPFISGFTSRNLFKQYSKHAKTDNEPAPKWYEGSDGLILGDGESIIICPQCGDEHCYSGPVYDECDECGYIKAHGNYECACCGEMILEYYDHMEICPICGWQEDKVQEDDPDYAGGANELSLNQFKVVYSLLKDECTRSETLQAQKRNNEIRANIYVKYQGINYQIDGDKIKNELVGERTRYINEIESIIRKNEQE